MSDKKYIKKLSDYAIASGLGAILITGLTGCSSSGNNTENNAFSNASQAKNAFVVVEELENGGYKIADEFPAKKTTVMLRDKNGYERILSKEEIEKLVKQESEKIDNGTSPLTNPELSSGHMDLGGVLLSSIAGAMIGSWIGGKLFNNQNFQAQKRANYKSPQAYSKSINSFKNVSPSKPTSSKKSGFFGSSSKKRSNSIFGG